MRRHLEVLLVVVVDDGEEDGHEDVGVDQEVQNEENGKEGAGVVRRHPAVMQQDGEIHHFLFLPIQKKKKKRKKASHDVGAIGRGDQDVEVEQDVQVAAEVGGAIHRVKASAQIHTHTHTQITRTSTRHPISKEPQEEAGLPHRFLKSFSATREKMRRLNIKSRKTTRI